MRRKKERRIDSLKSFSACRSTNNLKTKITAAGRTAVQVYSTAACQRGTEPT